MSDFYEQPEQIVKVVEPLRYRGNEVVLFHILDPNELAPKFRDPVLLQDVEDECNGKSRRITRETITKRRSTSICACCPRKGTRGGLDICAP